MESMAAVVVEISIEGEERPPEGAPVHVEVRDTTYVDTIAPLVAETSGAVESGLGTRLGAVQLDVPADAPSELTIFAHVDVDGDGGVSAGDFITTQAYPLVQSEAAAPIASAFEGCSEQFGERAGDRLPGPLLDEQELPGGVHLQEHVLALRSAAQVDSPVLEPQPRHE